MNIAVLLGGTSPERHVSMASGLAIARALSEKGHDIRLHDPARGADSLVSMNDLRLPGQEAPTDEELHSFPNENVSAALQALPKDVDVVFNALHGVPGEDGTVQAILHLRGIPCTGSDVLSSALTMDKAMTKRLLEYHLLPTPRWFMVERGEISPEMLHSMVEQYTAYPVVVKPNDGGSTIGLTIVDDRHDLPQAFHLAGRYSSKVLFEEYIDGRELTVAVLGDEALPIVEIRPHEGFYDYHNKYTAGRTDYLCPADLPRALAEEIRSAALTAHEVFGCGGYSRSDFRLDADGVPHCLEVNTLPGMTATSLVPKAAAAAGITFPELCERIVQLALV